MSFVFKWLFRKLATSILSRWILGGVVAALIGGAAIKWHLYKEGLREEGIQECVQEINQATVDALEAAVADEKTANAALRAALIAVAVVNEEAVARRKELESRVDSLSRQMAEQRKNDETYREWSDTTLPDGVADRLRKAAGSTAGSSN